MLVARKILLEQWKQNQLLFDFLKLISDWYENQIATFKMYWFEALNNWQSDYMYCMQVLNTCGIVHMCIYRNMFSKKKKKKKKKVVTT